MEPGNWWLKNWTTKWDASTMMRPAWTSTNSNPYRHKAKAVVLLSLQTAAFLGTFFILLQINSVYLLFPIYFILSFIAKSQHTGIFVAYYILKHYFYPQITTYWDYERAWKYNKRTQEIPVHNPKGTCYLIGSEYKHPHENRTRRGKSLSEGYNKYLRYAWFTNRYKYQI